MNNRTKNLLVISGFFVLMIMLFSKILFTSQIVRAPDILNEFYWGVAESCGKPLASVLKIDLSEADWNPYINSGHTNNGGMVSMQFNYIYRLIFGLVPAPASVAWFMVLHLFLGGAGVYAYCRLAGCSYIASLLGGLVFALSTENVSLINAGHVMKLATIAYTPWVFFFLERGFRSNRFFHYLCAGITLAFQFFNTHWQIAFYTCLGVAVYVIIRLLSGLYAGESGHSIRQVLLFSIGMTFFFLCSVAISLAPLASWSKDTNRGVHSGANQGKGGLEREEAMMWSMPPEETLALVIPGFFGLSRQEGGDKPAPGHTYYWGRMVFTQTASYFGLLPWLLLPLPILFRNDRITVAALVAVVAGLLFAMGKYTPFYQFLYDYLPGISRFRVPKMILFMVALGLGVLSARGLDLVMDSDVKNQPDFKKWIYSIMAIPFLLLLLLGIEKFSGSTIRQWLWELLINPTRYEAGGLELLSRRWLNIEKETGLAVFWSSLNVLVIYSMVNARLSAVIAASALATVFVADLWRVNTGFLVLTDLPIKAKGISSPAMDWIKQQQLTVNMQCENSSPLYRTLPMGNLDPMSYASARIPVIFTANAVQKRRWQEYMDHFSFRSSLPDLMNMRWVVYDHKQYLADAVHFGDKYRKVFSHGDELVLENTDVLPKAWLVSNTVIVTNHTERLKLLSSPDFNPRNVALVENKPPLAMQNQHVSGNVTVECYRASSMLVTAEPLVNSLLVVGEKYHEGWKVTVDGSQHPIVPVNHILRGVYLEPGRHSVEFRFDPLPFKAGKWLTLSSFAVFGFVAVREWLFLRRRTGHDI